MLVMSPASPLLTHSAGLASDVVISREYVDLLTQEESFQHGFLWVVCTNGKLVG